MYVISAGPAAFRIAQQMGESHAVFGIEARLPLAWRSALANNRKSDYPSLEQVVAPCVAALSAHTRSSPCVVAGLSFAGLMAFEAAHQLQGRGGKVDLVVVIDTLAMPPNPYQLAWNIWRQDWTKQPVGTGTDRLSQSVSSRLRRSWRTTQWLLGKATSRVRSFFIRPAPDLEVLTNVLDEHGMPMPWGLMARLWKHVDDSYRPRPLDSRGILFRTDLTDGVRTHDDSLGWKGLFTRGLEIIPIVGDHLSIFREHIPTLGREINEALKRHWPDQDHKVSIDAHQP